MDKPVKKKTLLLIPGAAALLVLAFALLLLVVKLLWGWVIPDIFPGAVEKGLIAGSITWFTALKIAILVIIVSRIAGINGNSFNFNLRPREKYDKE